MNLFARRAHKTNGAPMFARLCGIGIGIGFGMGINAGEGIAQPRRREFFRFVSRFFLLCSTHKRHSVGHVKCQGTTKQLSSCSGAKRIRSPRLRPARSWLLLRWTEVCANGRTGSRT